jgi:ketosteroid isomerase-like protein
MKKYMTYAVTAFFATIAISLAAPDKDAMMAKETAAWQAFKDKKPDDFKKVVDKDFRGVYAEGVSDMQKELDDMKKWDMKSFTISDYTAFSDEPDVMVTTYIVKIEGTYDGKDSSGTYNAGSVWKKEGKNWLAIFHTNIKQETAAK